MMKNRVVAVVMAAFAALGVRSALAVELVNLTSDAYAKGTQYREVGYGPIDSSRMTEAQVFSTQSPTSDSKDRFMSKQNKALPNYLSFHFLDAYHPNEMIFVNQLRLSVCVDDNSKKRRPTKAIVQGSVDGTGFRDGMGTTDDAESDEGWVDITDEESLVWPDVANGKVSVCDLVFEALRA